MKRITLFTGCLATAVGLCLTGCTDAGVDSAPSKTPSSSQPTSSSPTAPRTAVAEEENVFHPEKRTTVSCEHGEAVITDNSAEVTLKGHCGKVTVAAGNTIVHLDEVDRLIVDGNINRVEVASAKEIRVSKASKKNDVLYGGEKPAIRDDGLETQFEATAAP